MSLHRMGLQTSDNDGTEASAWNINNGDIYISQNAINHGPDWVAQTIFHEFAHNWDDNNPYWNDFLAISGWTESPWMPSLGFVLSHTKSIDGEWYYDPSATFARDYATANPNEDFAASFAAYFMDEAGMTFIGKPSAPGQLVGSAAIPEKIALINTWVASITDYAGVIGSATWADLADLAGSMNRTADSNDSGGFGVKSFQRLNYFH